MNFFFTANVIPLLTAVSLIFHIQSYNPLNHKEIGMGACSAVFISPTMALSAQHCITDATGHMWVKGNDGVSYSAKVIKHNRFMDLCLIEVKGPPHQFVKLGPPVHVGERVLTMNNSDDMPYTYGEGVVGNIVIDHDTHILMVIHSAAILPGASGSGLFNTKGELIGINTMSNGPFSYAVDVSIIDGFLNAPNRR